MFRALALVVLVAACSRQAAQLQAARGVELLRVKVVATYPHDRGAFTQGLEVFEGLVYESTGLVGRSSLRRVELASGVVEKAVPIERYFAEGLTRVGDKLYQLTWQDGRLLIWNLRSMTLERELSYSGEGWGICWDGKRLVTSDGSARLTFRDPETFASVGEVTVKRDGVDVRALNELECVDGLVYANVWQAQSIVRIDPKSGEVTGLIDASGLLGPEESIGTDVLNGIAWLPERGRFLITGKQWPKTFEVELVPAP